ncbi:MAG TPA: hypothetical protein GXX69_08370 [Firmicutes bacterium]|nr:hypothetical protein [Bacillota bacterium]
MFARLIKMPSLRRRQSTALRQGLHDRIKLTIDGLLICLERELGFNWPHEVHIVVPRAEEIRTYQDGKLVEERRILSSISVVHAPYHPPAEGDRPPPRPIE